MARFILLTVLAVMLAAVSAEPPHFRTSRRGGQLRTNIRFLSRQEATTVEPAVDAAGSEASAPYPAAGVTPEIPFDLPTETEAPAPDQTYGPPATTPAIEPAAEEIATVGNLVAQNFIQPRNKAAPRGKARSAPLLLRAAPVAGPATRAGVVEIVRATPIIVYSLQ